MGGQSDQDRGQESQDQGHPPRPHPPRPRSRLEGPQTRRRPRNKRQGSRLRQRHRQESRHKLEEKRTSPLVRQLPTAHPEGPGQGGYGNGKLCGNSFSELPPPGQAIRSQALLEDQGGQTAEAVPRPLKSIVERWGDLSDELKRAVLVVVG